MGIKNPRPASKHRLLTYGLAELPNDTNNEVDGENYLPGLNFRNSHSYKSLSGDKVGIWSGRRHDLLSLREIKTFFALEGRPNILSIREQYLFADAAAQEKLETSSARNLVMSIDFVLTLPPSAAGGPLRYMGLSVKPPRLSIGAAALVRKAKEMKKLEHIGWRWNFIEMPSQQNFLNHAALRKWAKAHPIDEAASDARQLALMLYRTDSNKPLKNQLAMFGKRLGIPESDQFFVFAAAYYLGYLGLDHRHPVDELEIPALMPPALNVYGNLI
jgi:hypothetical protein